MWLFEIKVNQSKSSQNNTVPPQYWDALVLTHLPLVPHTYASVGRINIGSDNGLSPIGRKAII